MRRGQTPQARGGPSRTMTFASFPCRRRHATPQGAWNGIRGKAYIRMCVALERGEGRDISDRHSPRQRNAIVV